jgi:hypothetical protein
LRFRLLSRNERPPSDARDEAFLQDDRWDDYTFKTTWHLYYVDTEGTTHTIGMVKIGQSGLDTGSPQLRSTFTRLGKDFFSLGQDDDYYWNLQQLDDGIRIQILTALRDVSFNLTIFDQALDEDVMQTSLMRGISETTVRNQLHRMARGGARLSPYAFTYLTPEVSSTGDSVPVSEISFEVQPESLPPSNVHVLVGRNGVGKSFLLNNMTNALVRPGSASSGGVIRV